MVEETESDPLSEVDPDDRQDREEPVDLDELDPADVPEEPPPEDRPEEAEPVDEFGEPVDGEEVDGFGDAPQPADFEDEGPPADEEMPLTQHVEEMILRLAVVLAIAGVVTAVVFPFAEEPILFIWESVLPTGEGTRPRVYGPLELKLTELKFATLVGFVAALPVFVYETYRFMRPGLYPHERRYYLAAVPTSLVLAFVGIAFSYFLVLPAIFTYFHTYSKNAGKIAFALSKTFDLILAMMGYMALVFQIPLFIMLAVMMNLVSREWMENRRIYFWGGFLGLSVLFSFDPTGMAPLIVTLTMIGLFEGTLALLRWTGN